MELYLHVARKSKTESGILYPTKIIYNLIEFDHVKVFLFLQLSIILKRKQERKWNRYFQAKTKIVCYPEIFPEN